MKKLSEVYRQLELTVISALVKHAPLSIAGQPCRNQTVMRHPSPTANFTSALQFCSTESASLSIGCRCMHIYLPGASETHVLCRDVLQLCSNTQILQLCKDVHNEQPSAFFFKACCSMEFQSILQVGARLSPAARPSFLIRDLRRWDSYSSRWRCSIWVVLYKGCNMSTRS